MPFVDITLARGKSKEYLQDVSDAAHDALVLEFDMQPLDRFQVIHQYDQDEIIYTENFRGGPRSDDFMVIRITDGTHRDVEQKSRFYKTLVDLLEQGAGVRPQDVFVMIQVIEKDNFSFGDGLSAPAVIAALAARQPA